MNKYLVHFKTVVNSQFNTPDGKNTDRDIHKMPVEAGNPKVAAKRAIEYQRKCFNRTIQIFGTPIKLEE